MRKLVLVDFDGTLFDIQAFAREMAKIFQDCGGIDFFATFPKNAMGTYSLQRHIGLVPTRYKRKRTKRYLRELFARSPQFLFGDALNFLLLLRQNQQNAVVLFTRGEREYQDKKVFQALGANRNLFDKIMIVEGASKASHIKKISGFYGAKRIFFVDDSPQELIDAKIAAPDIVTILVDRYQRRGHCSSEDFSVGNLAEAIKIIRHDE